MVLPQHQYIYGGILDKYLALGYYRMGGNFCTVNQIWYNEQYYNVYWLRYDLKKIKTLKEHLQIIKKSKQFNIEVQKYIPSKVLEDLYQNYVTQVNFDASESLTHYLTNYESFYNNKIVVFNSELITIKHKENIIAAGIFDNGTKAIAGIINFYEPNYKKYSLGKMLVLAKLQYAISQHKQYYYPGYIVPGVPKFNYKTFVGEDCIEVWDAENKVWVAYETFFKNNS